MLCNETNSLNETPAPIWTFPLMVLVSLFVIAHRAWLASAITKEANGRQACCDGGGCGCPLPLYRCCLTVVHKSQSGRKNMCHNRNESSDVEILEERSKFVVARRTSPRNGQGKLMSGDTSSCISLRLACTSKYSSAYE